MNPRWRRVVPRSGKAAVFCALFSVMMVNLSGATIAIYGTGVDSNGNPLPVGAVDPHYTLTVGGTTYVASGASVSESNQYNISIGWPIDPVPCLSLCWVTTPTDQWIGPTSDIVSIQGSGTFDYVTTFDLSGLLPNTAELVGKFSVDNTSYGMFLNGQPIPGTTTADIFTFQRFVNFDITSGFVPGMNTLSFVVYNSPDQNQYPDPNPTGLLVQLSGTASIDPVPEPNAIWLMAGGLLTLPLLRRRV